jgi:hypothetical protein
MVLGAEDLLVDFKRATVQGLGLAAPALIIEIGGEVEEDRASVPVLGAGDLLADRKRPPE